jgi:hypothetical protein
MNAHPATAEPTPSAEGREPTDYFAAGHAGGAVNPFARRVAGLRTAMVSAVSDEDMVAITARLVRDARDGNNTATKLLFQYVVGRPGPAVDPDRLAIDEFRRLQQSAVPPEALTAMLRCVPAEFWLQLWPLLAEAQAAQLADQFKGLCAQADERDRRRAERAARKAERRQRRREKRERARQANGQAAPSTNGDYGGAAAVHGEGAPSTNGDFGETGAADGGHRPSTNGEYGPDALTAFLNWLRGQRRAADGGAEG